MLTSLKAMLSWSKKCIKSPMIATLMSNGSTSNATTRADIKSEAIYGTTATTAARPRAPTVADLEKAARTMELLGPIAEYMRAQGFDPAEGCVMFLPKAKQDEYQAWGPLPSFVRFSPIIDDIFLVRDPFYKRG